MTMVLYITDARSASKHTTLTTVLTMRLLNLTSCFCPSIIIDFTLTLSAEMDNSVHHSVLSMEAKMDIFVQKMYVSFSL